MGTFKFVVNDRGKSYKIEKDQKECPILDKKIGDKIEGGFLGLDGFELQITGGTDKDGFPMMKDVESHIKKKIILTKGVCFSGEKKIKKKKFIIKGYRKRKTVRGNTITADVTQVNCKIVKHGSKRIEDIFVSPKTEKPDA